jgi:hypothetical protein
LKFGLAEIGIAIMVGPDFAWLFGFYSLVYGLISFFQAALIVLFLTVVGFVLYIFGRKTFLKRIESSVTAFVFLVIFGLIPTIEGLFVGLLFAIGMGISGSSPVQVSLTLEELMYQIVALAWILLKIVSGTLLFADGIQFKFDRFSTLPLKQRIGLPQTRYPKDLFARYVERYPHNPEGVLEWHIHKKMKEGKTREQAIEELNLEIT